jgi:hypothetical protein
MPSLEELGTYLLIFLIIGGMGLFTLWVWGSMLGGLWESRTDISKFLRTNPLGEWVLRLFLAFPAFALFSTLLDPTFRTVGYLIFYGIWLIFALLIYFVWL